MILILRFFVNKYSVASIRRAPILVVVYLLLFSPECQSLNAQVLKEVKTWERHKDEVFCLTISPDEKMIASGSADNTVWLWDLDSGKTRLTLDGFHGGAASLAFTKDAKTLISASWEPTIQFWDVDTGKEKDRINKGGVLFALAPDEKLLAYGIGTIKLFDMTTRKEIAALKSHTEPLSSLAFSRNGEWLASGSKDSTVKLWQVATGKEIVTLKGHTSWVHSLIFTPDGKLLISADNRTINFWEIPQGKEVKRLKNYGGSSLALSPDGKTLAAGFSVGFIRLWDVPTSKELVDLRAHSDRVFSLAFTSDGKTLISGSGRRTEPGSSADPIGIVKIWALSLDK